VRQRQNEFQPCHAASAMSVPKIVVKPTRPVPIFTHTLRVSLGGGGVAVAVLAMPLAGLC
jgi:hypothetical protein